MVLSRKTKLTTEQISEIIELAWADDVSFDMIQSQTGLPEPEVKALMRKTLKTGSYRLWRKRVKGRTAKHEKRPSPSGDNRIIAGKNHEL